MGLNIYFDEQAAGAEASPFLAQSVGTEPRATHYRGVLKAAAPVREHPSAVRDHAASLSPPTSRSSAECKTAMNAATTNKRQNANGHDRESGHAVVETALFAPWIFLLFAAIFDFGMYSRALIITDNAARAAALQTAVSEDTAADSGLACGAVLLEMKTVSNAKRLTTCNALPLIVTAAASTDSEGFKTSKVSVTYQTQSLIPLPYLPGRLKATRVAQMRVKP